MWVAVDTMSGDLGPAGLVEGSIDAINQYGTSVVLVGREDILGELILGYTFDSDKLKIIHA